MDISIKNIPCVSPQVIKDLWLNPNSAKTLLSRYEKQWIFTRVKRGFYVNNTIEVEWEKLSSILFPGSYISLDTVLYESWIIKQASRALYCVSTTGGYEEIKLWDYTLFKYGVSLASREGIYLDRAWNFRSSRERAFLDSLYLKLFSRYYPGECEYNFMLVDDVQVKKLLPIYPQRIAKYYESLKKMDALL
jgi:hypothetical protein